MIQSKQHGNPLQQQFWHLFRIQSNDDGDTMTRIEGDRFRPIAELSEKLTPLSRGRL